jgi:hypothetical protein
MELGTIKREDIFVTTKLWNADHGRVEDAMDGCKWCHVHDTSHQCSIVARMVLTAGVGVQLPVSCHVVCMYDQLSHFTRRNLGWTMWTCG